MRSPRISAVSYHDAELTIIFPWPCLDDHSRFRRCGSAQHTHEALDALVAAREPMPVYQILPDAHRVAAPRQREFPARLRSMSVRA